MGEGDVGGEGYVDGGYAPYYAEGQGDADDGDTPPKSTGALVDLQDQEVLEFLTDRASEPWSSSRLCGHLTAHMLDVTAHRSWPLLDSSVKLRLLCSFLLLRQRQRAELADSVETVLHMAERDAEEWVRATGLLVGVIFRASAQSGEAEYGHDAAPGLGPATDPPTSLFNRLNEIAHSVTLAEQTGHDDDADDALAPVAPAGGLRSGHDHHSSKQEMARLFCSTVQEITARLDRQASHLDWGTTFTRLPREFAFQNRSVWPAVARERLDEELQRFNPEEQPTAVEAAAPTVADAAASTSIAPGNGPKALGEAKVELVASRSYQLRAGQSMESRLKSVWAALNLDGQTSGKDGEAVDASTGAKTASAAASSSSMATSLAASAALRRRKLEAARHASLAKGSHNMSSSERARALLGGKRRGLSRRALAPAAAARPGTTAAPSSASPATAVAGASGLTVGAVVAAAGGASRADSAPIVKRVAGSGAGKPKTKRGRMKMAVLDLSETERLERERDKRARQEIERKEKEREARAQRVLDKKRAVAEARAAAQAKKNQAAAAAAAAKAAPSLPPKSKGAKGKTNADGAPPTAVAATDTGEDDAAAAAVGSLSNRTSPTSTARDDAMLLLSAASTLGDLAADLTSASGERAAPASADLVKEEKRKKKAEAARKRIAKQAAMENELQAASAPPSTDLAKEERRKKKAEAARKRIAKQAAIQNELQARQEALRVAKLRLEEGDASPAVKQEAGQSSVDLQRQASDEQSSRKRQLVSAKFADQMPTEAEQQAAKKVKLESKLGLSSAFSARAPPPPPPE